MCSLPATEARSHRGCWRWSYRSHFLENSISRGLLPLCGLCLKTVILRSPSGEGRRSNWWGRAFDTSRGEACLAPTLPQDRPRPSRPFVLGNQYTRVAARNGTFGANPRQGGGMFLSLLPSSRCLRGSVAHSGSASGSRVKPGAPGPRPRWSPKGGLPLAGAGVGPALVGPDASDNGLASGRGGPAPGR